MRSSGLTRTATCRVAHGIDEATGELLSARVLASRVRYLASLVAECGQAVLDAHWDVASIQAISARQALDGTRMPLQGYHAVAKLWGPASLPDGVKGFSRVGRMGAELAARQLRSAAYRLQTCAVLLAGGLPSDCPDVVSGEAMRRRIGRRLDRGEGLPGSLLDFEPIVPRVPALVPLTACDDKFFLALTGPDEQAAHTALDADLAERRQRHASQETYYQRKARGVLGDGERPQRRSLPPRHSGAVLVVRVRLPIVARPTTPAEWSWHRLVIRIPERYRSGTCSPPTLRIAGSITVRADVPVTYPAPRPLFEHGKRPVRVLGVDWGVRRLLSATVVRDIGPPSENGCFPAVAVDGRPLYFQAGRLQGKARRIGANRTRVQAKADQWKRLTIGLPEGDPRQVKLQVGRARAQAELADLAAAQTHLNEQIARLAARWLVEQALAAGCQAIALEDLKTLEHRGLGKRNNERCSLAMRGKVVEFTRQAAALTGLMVMTVNARGTSSVCPRCGHRLTHLRRPGGDQGHAWAWCGTCGYSADRDHAASENVGRRAINPMVRKVRHKPTRRRGLHPTAHLRGRCRTLKLIRTGQSRRRPASARTLQSGLRLTSIPSGEMSSRQAGSAAMRLAIPPPHPSPGVGHRRAGPGPRRLRQAGHNKMHAAVLPTRLDGLLTAYRTSLRATPVLYWAPPWTSLPSSGKQAITVRTVCDARDDQRQEHRRQ